MHALFGMSILAVIEGLTEFIPVSSSGHLILARHFFDIQTGNDLAVDAVLQLATACALLAYFWPDILNLAYTALYWVLGKPTRPQDVRELVAIIIGTIPAVILGLFLEKTMDTIFRSSILVAVTLVVGAVVMLAAEYVLRKVRELKSIENVTLRDGVVIGLFQALALVPGMSRSGMTMSGGMFLGYSRAAAARFGFILSLPVLFGSGLKKLYELQSAGALTGLGIDLVIACVVAFVVGLISVAWFMRLVKTIPFSWFAYYRIALAVVVVVALS